MASKPKVGNLSTPIKDAFEVFMKIFPSDRLVANAFPLLLFPVILLLIAPNSLHMRRDSPSTCDTCVLFAGAMPSSSPRLTFLRNSSLQGREQGFGPFLIGPPGCEGFQGQRMALGVNEACRLHTQIFYQLMLLATAQRAAVPDPRR